MRAPLRLAVGIPSYSAHSGTARLILTIVDKMAEPGKLYGGSGKQGPYKCGLCGGPPQETPKPPDEAPA
ncbi:hypothetical protein VTK56DRAFT_5767 [Thermocarpiscus australiensis]